MTLAEDVLREIESLKTDIESKLDMDARTQTKWARWLDEIKADVERASK